MAISKTEKESNFLDLITFVKDTYWRCFLFFELKQGVGTRKDKKDKILYIDQKGFVGRILTDLS